MVPRTVHSFELFRKPWKITVRLAHFGLSRLFRSLTALRVRASRFKRNFFLKDRQLLVPGHLRALQSPDSSRQGRKLLQSGRCSLWEMPGRRSMVNSSDKRPVRLLLGASLSGDPFPISPLHVQTLRRPFGLLLRQRRVLLSPVSLSGWEVREMTGQVIQEDATSC